MIGVPVVRGMIDRRILVNYRVDPEVLRSALPSPFRPKLAGGAGVAGICLIRLAGMGPKFWPGWLGLRSENAAHRIAVEWESGGEDREGVYVPRRDTSSRLSTLVGGRFFPGDYRPATFEVSESEDEVSVALRSKDGATSVSVRGTICSDLPPGSVFHSLEEASQFFEKGSVGYSATRENGVYDGLELKSLVWRMEPLAVSHVESSFFSDEKVFPAGSVAFDSALIMRKIPHEWHAKPQLLA
jgi:hypothetical protein